MIHLPKPQLGLLSYLLTQQLYLGSQLQSNIVSFPGHDDCSATTLLENLVNFLGCTCNDCCLYSNCRSLTGSHCYNIKKKIVCAFEGVSSSTEIFPLFQKNLERQTTTNRYGFLNKISTEWTVYILSSGTANSMLWRLRLKKKPLTLNQIIVLMIQLVIPFLMHVPSALNPFIVRLCIHYIYDVHLHFQLKNFLIKSNHCTPLHRQQALSFIIKWKPLAVDADANVESHSIITVDCAKGLVMNRFNWIITTCQRIENIFGIIAIQQLPWCWPLQCSFKRA